MRKLQKVKLKEMGKVFTGSTPPTKDESMWGSDYLFVKPSDMKGGVRWVKETEKKLTCVATKTAKGRLLPAGTTCVVCIGTIGKICQLHQPAATNQQINSIVVDRKKYDPDYIFYLMIQSISYVKVVEGGSASGREHVKKSTFEEIELQVLPFKEQKKVGQILNVYDNLIENNNRRIAILEDIAQSLYREWFAHFRFPGHETCQFKDSELGRIPEGWEVVSLGDLINIKKGKNITKKTIVEGETPVVAGGLKPAYFHNTANTKFPVITVSASGANAGFVNMYFLPVWASDCSFIDEDVSPFVYYYFLLMTNRQVEITRMQTGAAQPHVYPKDLMRLEVANVPEELIKKFNLEVSSQFELIANLKKRNEILVQQRDMLLPKLISGNIEV